MSNKISETNTVTTESEIGSNGVGHSKMLSKSGEVMASPEELSQALAMQQATINKLIKENEDLKKASTKTDSSADKLIELLANAISAKQEKPVETENVNKTSNFNQRTIIDGNSLMEAQASLMMYKNEPKVPISIPKTFANQFGPSLAVAVNGVRVSIPCDGKTYMINATHAEAAKERLAKVDRLLSDTEPQIIETNA